MTVDQEDYHAMVQALRWYRNIIEGREGTEDDQAAAHLLIQGVAEAWDVKVEEIMGEGRQRAIVRPRQMAMYMVRKYLRMSYPEIGKLFGRDHSTVHHAVNLMARRLEP